MIKTLEEIRAAHGDLHVEWRDGIYYFEPSFGTVAEPGGDITVYVSMDPLLCKSLGNA